MLSAGLGGQHPCVPRSVVFRVEFGRTPRRDRSTSGSRSVVFRVEFGPVPARDRSYPASRSVQCGVSGHLRQGEWVSASSVVVPGGVVLGAGVRVSRAGRSWGGSTGACVCPGVLGVAHSRMLRAGGNRGIMRNRNVGSGQNPAPMCADPSHRTWEPDHHIRRSPEKPDIPTKNNPCPAEIPVSHVQHPRHPRPKRAPCLRCPDTPHPTAKRCSQRMRVRSARRARRLRRAGWSRGC